MDSPLRSLVDMLQTVHVSEEFAKFLISQLREHYNNERIDKVPKMNVGFYFHSLKNLDYLYLF